MAARGAAFPDRGCQGLPTRERRSLRGQRAGRPFRCTKEPSQDMMWALRECICEKTGVREHPKHYTKEYGHFLPPPFGDA